jgi:hypothetical protein
MCYVEAETDAWCLSELEYLRFDNIEVAKYLVSFVCPRNIAVGLTTGKAAVGSEAFHREDYLILLFISTLHNILSILLVLIAYNCSDRTFGSVALNPGSYSGYCGFESRPEEQLL